MTPLALDQEGANIALSLDPGSSWLVEPDCPIPRVDMRKPGSKKPFWRWRVVDIEAFLATRIVPPGHPSPFGP